MEISKSRQNSFWSSLSDMHKRVMAQDYLKSLRSNDTKKARRLERHYSKENLEAYIEQEGLDRPKTVDNDPSPSYVVIGIVIAVLTIIATFTLCAVFDSTLSTIF